MLNVSIPPLNSEYLVMSVRHSFSSLFAGQSG